MKVIGIRAGVVAAAGDRGLEPVGARRGTGGVVDRQQRMLHEVRADGEVGDNVDAQRAEVCGRADSRAQKYRRAVVGARRTRSLRRRRWSRRRPIARRARDPSCRMTRSTSVSARHGQVGSRACRFEIGERGAHAHAPPNVAGEQTDTHCAGPVVILDRWHAELECRVERGELVVSNLIRRRALDCNRAVAAVPRRRRSRGRSRACKRTARGRPTTTPRCRGRPIRRSRTARRATRRSRSSRNNRP